MDLTAILEQTVSIIKKYYTESKKEPVLKFESPQQLAAQIDLQIQKKGIPLKRLFSELEKIVLHSPRTSSTGFFNLLYAGKIMPAVIADMLAVMLNNTMHTYKAAGVHVLIEQEVIDFFCKKIGYKDGDGTFTPGGSLANMSAMIMGRNAKDPSIRKTGMSGYKKRMIAYVSDQGHYSLIKSADMIGIGRDNIRIIPSDMHGKMNTKVLEKVIKDDIKAGCLPFFVKGTAGTTVLGAFDPFKEIGRIAKKYKMRFHVDGSLGGTLLLNKKYRHLLEGSELADSFVWNPHKMMNVPILASVLLVKEKGVLSRNFNESADYLYQAGSEMDRYNPGIKSIQCGRRNDALKVRTALKFLGETGYEKRINNQFANARYAVELIKKDEAFTLVMEPQCLNVCFQVIGMDIKMLCDQLDKEGIIKVSYGIWMGKAFIRLMCVDADMTKADIKRFFVQIKKYISSH